MSSFVTGTSEKKRGIALLLCLIGGLFGFHLFYVGRIGKGILYICTCGLLGIGVFFDFFKILFGCFRDNVSAPLRKWCSTNPLI